MKKISLDILRLLSLPMAETTLSRKINKVFFIHHSIKTDFVFKSHTFPRKMAFHNDLPLNLKERSRARSTLRGLLCLRLRAKDKDVVRWIFDFHFSDERWWSRVISTCWRWHM
jgi:hypothetical protein